MKKTTTFVLSILFISFLATPAYASLGFIKPSSKLYFLQPALESVRLFFTFSKEAKTDYLIELADRRTEEINISPSIKIANRYSDHFDQLEKIVEKTSEDKKEQVTEKIKESNLRQQEVLAKVYNQVPDEAKDAILNAQENSSKNVANVIEATQGTEKEKEYVKQIEQIQRVEKKERTERLKQALKEETPNANPSDNIIKEIKSGQELNPLNPLNTLFEDQQTGDNNQGENEKIEPASPAEIQQPIQQQ